MDLNGSWEESYSHGRSAEYVPYEEFELTITNIDGEIQGFGSDTSSEELKFSILGFFQDGVLSFVKRYEGFYFHDEEGNTYIDKETQSAEIQYTGTFDLKENAFVGTWEILIQENQVGFQEEYDAEYAFGEFRLSKIH